MNDAEFAKEMEKPITEDDLRVYNTHRGDCECLLCVRMFNAFLKHCKARRESEKR